MRQAVTRWAVVTLVLLAAGAAEAKIIRVPGAAKNITEAVAAAAAGDTVSLAPGTYSRNDTGEEYPIYLEIPITILGAADSTKCVIIPDAMKPGVHYPEIACFIARNTRGERPVVISHVTFRRGGIKGLSVDAYNCHMVMESCRFERIDTALRFGGDIDGRVSDCVAVDNEMGLSVTKGRAVFERNEITRSKKSIAFEWASGVAQGNRIYAAIADGIAMNQSNDVKLVDNYIEGSAQCGISIRASSPLVTGNELVNNNYSIWCTDKAAPEIKRNLVRRSRGYDVGCEKGASPVVGGSLVDGNYFYGDGVYLLHNLTDFPIEARDNYWGSDCPQSARFTGQVHFSPWADRTKQRELTDCP